MSTSTAPVVPLLAPKEVALDQIQFELNQIWKQAAAKGNGNGPAATRATTFNLLIYEPSEIQLLLTQLGFYSGPINGIFGPRMQAALHAAQEKYSLPKSNHATSDLIEKLRQHHSEAGGNLGLNGESASFSSDAKGAGIADAIASQNPCRVVSLFPKSASDEDSLSAQVSAYCPIRKKQTSNLICCEYIAFNGTVGELTDASSLVQSLLINDLPKFLWWKGDLEHQEELFRKISSPCDSVIVDSATFSTPLQGLQQMSALSQQGLNLADLNWKRLASWQELTAEAFDPPERRAALLEVDQVTLDYEAGNPTQALLFIGWLASRLQWTPISCVEEKDVYDIFKIKFHTPNQRLVEAELAALPMADTGEVVGDLIDLKLASTNLEADCCTVICSQTTGCMRMEAGGGAQSCRVQQVTPMADQKPEFLLSKHLQRWTRDALFEDSLKVVQEILNYQS